MRKFDSDQLLIASHNKDKISEIKNLLSPFVRDFLTAIDHNLPEPDENGKTFHENARIKALAAATVTKIPTLADDSGLCVTALNGAPGIYSARWVENKNYQTAIDRIFGELNGAAATAEFICVLALAQPDGETEFFEGRCSGILIPAPRGDMGFGYDPYFIPDGHDKTFAELGAAVKDKISHRARALAALLQGMRA